MKIKILLSSIFLLSGFTKLKAQQLNSSEIYHEIEKFASPYRVLYLAAHPDDENTRLISYLANEVNARTAYLSLTRGDGGQNLIGDEKNALLGVMRTQELLSARRIDGGKQFFTRAVDFGYSKTSEESFELWGKDAILSDVVFIIRNYKPHVIVNRFPLDNYSGHGHHQASAILSNEAFELANDQLAFPDQLSSTEVWKTTTLFHNSSSWWDKTLEERAKNDESIYEINIGKYNSLLGYSYNELAALSRSQHKSQGFGSAPKKGDEFEYLQHIKGNYKADQVFFEDMLDSIDRKWLKLSPNINKVLSEFDFNDPSASVNDLLAIRSLSMSLDSTSDRFQAKIADLNKIILMCLGTSVELIVEQEVSNTNSHLSIEVSAINRSNNSVVLKEIEVNKEVHSWNRALSNNVFLTDTLAVHFENNTIYSVPYWLNGKYVNRFNNEQQELLKPDTDPLNGIVTLSINDQDILFESPIIYKWTDRVKGGLQKDLRILPEITLDFDKSIYIPKDSSFSGSIIIRSHSNKDLNGKLIVKGSENVAFTSDVNQQIKANSSLSIPFEASFVKSSSLVHNLSAYFVVDEDTFNQSLTNIEYDHIKPQSVLQTVSSKFVPVKLPATLGKIAYVEGPDNEMIVYLKELGCDIKTFTRDDLLSGKLSSFDVLLFGIRSLNVDPEWNKHAEAIKNFTKDGGLVIVQYQTSRNSDVLDISPYKFEISRNRVTDENASANFRRPEHPILNTPFLLKRTDFDGWNQERGLYFAENWDEKFTTILSWHDKGELDQAGGLIIGDYGKGAFIYTGISFFRHIPFGVPGSYKLFLNILAYKK